MHWYEVAIFSLWYEVTQKMKWLGTSKRLLSRFERSHHFLGNQFENDAVFRILNFLMYPVKVIISKTNLRSACALSSRLSIGRSSHFLPWNLLRRTKLVLFFLVYQKTDKNTCICIINWIPTVKLKIPGKAFLKTESRTSVTFKL